MRMMRMRMRMRRNLTSRPRFEESRVASQPKMIFLFFFQIERNNYDGSSC
jgi:hypothetical protein